MSIDISNFESMKDIKKYISILERLLIEYPNDININKQIKYLNDLVTNILSQEKTNMEWLDIIYSIISKRLDKYNLEYINGIRNGIKWNTYLFAREDINIDDIAKQEVKGIIFVAPDLYSEYYKDQEFVVYDTFYGDNSIYLEKKRNLTKFLSKCRLYGLDVYEAENLEEILFNNYKKEMISNEKIR